MVINYFESFFKSQVISVSDNRLPFVVIDYLKRVLKNRIFWVGNRLPYWFYQKMSFSQRSCELAVVLTILHLTRKKHLTRKCLSLLQ